MTLARETTIRLASADTLLGAATVLLTMWREQPSNDPARHTNDADLHSIWSDLSVDAERALDPTRPNASGSDELSEDDKQTIVQLVADHETTLGIDAIDAIAWGLDIVASSTFIPTWVQHIRGLHGDAPYVLQTDEIFPVADPVVRRNGKPLPLTSRGSAGPEIPAGELPHLRAFEATDFEVAIDFAHEEPLESIAESERSVAAAHLNARDTEFAFPHSKKDIYPIRARALATQKALVLRAVDEAIARDLRILVIPELTGHASFLEEIQAKLDAAAEDHLVVPGSFHAESPNGLRTNIARGLLTGSPPLEHHKLVRFTNDLRPSVREREGIDTPSPRRLTVYQAGRFRFAILICKDLLHKPLSDLIAHVGGNWLCVPAMSKKTSLYHARVLDHVAESQAVTLVANGPTEWITPARSATTATSTTAATPATPESISYSEDVCVIGQPIPNRDLIRARSGSVPAPPQIVEFKIGDAEADIVYKDIDM